MVPGQFPPLGNQFRPLEAEHPIPQDVAVPFAPKPSSAYVSPALWARRIMAKVAAGERPDISANTLKTARRIDALSVMVKGDLDAFEAPLHVYRWVAWAPPKGPRRVKIPVHERLELVQHLRRTFERGSADGWFLEREHSAAFRVWMDACAAARKRGGIMPAADQIPAESYQEAIVASADRTRRPGAELREQAKQIARQLNQG